MPFFIAGVRAWLSIYAAYCSSGGAVKWRGVPSDGARRILIVVLCCVLCYVVGCMVWFYATWGQCFQAWTLLLRGARAMVRALAMAAFRVRVEECVCT